MNTEAALLDAIIHDPYDISPWMALSDYMEETGDPREQAVKYQLMSRGIDLGPISKVDTHFIPTKRNSLGMKLALIPPGKFMMGSPNDEVNRFNDELLHEVEITKPFFLGVYEVTQDQYKRIMGVNPSNFKGDDLPVETVSWDDCQELCDKLSKREGKKYRLPTESEWEYTCRAGTITPFTFGNSLSSNQANINGNSPYGRAERGPYLARTCKVGSYKPNAFGLYDMHGNVREWCSDWYDKDYYGTAAARRDPSGPSEGSFRVRRGGCWSNNGRYCRSANRYRYEPDYRYQYFGFRLAADC